jgi:hypothetical protein
MKHKSGKYKLKYWFSSIKDWTPKKDEKVFCCYDGKYSRRKVGKIIRRQGSTLTVEFVTPNGKKASFRANRKRGGRYNGWLTGDDTIMDKLFGCVGDYYSVCQYKMADDLTQ